MLVNNIFLILIILIILPVILECFYNNRHVEGYMAVTPTITFKHTPKNTYYENKKISQDFDQDGVLQDYNSNSIIIQEEPGYILTN
jgi:hypothetical protein